MDGFDRRVAVAYFRALGRGGLLGLATLPALGWAVSGDPRPDPLLASGLATVSLLSLLLGSLLRRRRLRLEGPGMAAAVLVLAGAATLCMLPTGGVRSPLVLLLATVVGLGGLTLAPLGGFLAMSGISLLLGIVAISDPQGPPVRDLVVQLGLLGLFGFVVNLLACRLREQRAELVGLAMRDPLSGALRSSFFRARLVALVEDAKRRERGVDVVLLDLGTAAADRLRDAGAAVLDAVRADDLVGRVGETALAVALETDGPTLGPRVAERLARKLRPIAEPRVAHARAAEPSGDPIDVARALLAEAEADLSRPRSGREPVAQGA